MADKPSPDPHDFAQARRAFGERVPMTKDAWNELDERERECAFTVANVATIDPIADVWRALDKSIERGTPFEDFKAEIGETLVREWGGEIPGRMETIFRTNVQTAYSAGRYEIYSAPAVKESHPFLRFDAIHDDRVDPDCEDLDGTTLDQDDAFWADHTPPLHFNCRCTVTPVAPEDVDEERGPTGRAGDAETDEGFGGRPSTEGEDWAPNFGDYPGPLGGILSGKIGA